MRSYRWIMAMLAAGTVLLVAAPRSEAGHFSLSIFFPIPCAPPPPPCPPPAPPPSQTWIPGHYEVHPDKVWVPGGYETVWVPPVYRTVWDGCRWARVLCEPGHYATIQHPGHFEYRDVRVWVPGHYELARRYDDPPNSDPPPDRERTRGDADFHDDAPNGARD